MPNELERVDEEQAEATTVAVAIQSDGLIDKQVATAKQYPRSVTRFRREAEAMASLDEKTAADCLYGIPRGGKVIEGPSVRFAEILLHSWGNARAAAEVIEVGDADLTAMGTFADLERNVVIQKKVKRGIMDKHGRRYNADMIGVTGNAATSIALRNAVLAGIPKAIWNQVYENARLASLGKGGTLTQKRQEALAYFGKLGITPEKVFALLSVAGIEDLKEDHLITLRGLANALKDGESTVEEIFNPRATAAANPTPDLSSRVKPKALTPGDDEDARVRREDARLAKGEK